MNAGFLDKNVWDSDFLASFARTNIDYTRITESSLLEAYRTGIYDATINFVGETNLKINGVSRTVDEVKKFLRQFSFGGELSLEDHAGNFIKTVAEQERLVENWFQKNDDDPVYTQLILMIPKDNDREKLAKIARDFLQKQFPNNRYLFVLHTDTNIFHYHVIVEIELYDDLLFKIRSNFINLCIEYGTKLF